MKKGKFVVLVVVALAGAAFGAHGEKRRLVWRDEFNGQSLDPRLRVIKEKLKERLGSAIAFT